MLILNIDDKCDIKQVFRLSNSALQWPLAATAGGSAASLCCFRRRCCSPAAAEQVWNQPLCSGSSSVWDPDLDGDPNHTPPSRRLQLRAEQAEMLSTAARVLDIALTGESAVGRV